MRCANSDSMFPCCIKYARPYNGSFVGCFNDTNCFGGYGMKIDAMTFRNDPMLKLLLISGTILLYLGVAAAYFDEWWHADQRVETFFTLPRRPVCEHFS